VQRLRRRKDFDRAFAMGRAVPGALFVLRFVRNDKPLECARVGIAVGRRLGSAVVRNRLRRRWREVVRLGPVMAPGWDVVVIVRAGCQSAPWHVVRSAWAEVLRRNRLAGVVQSGGVPGG